MAESTIVSGQCAFLKYTESGWAPLDKGISTFWVLHNPTTGAYRIVARDDATQQYIVNTGITLETVYNKATETFVQLKLDEVYGLNFPSVEACTVAASLFQQMFDAFHTATKGVHKQRPQSERLPPKKSKDKPSSGKSTLTKKAAKNAVEELVAAEPVAPVIPESLRDKAAKEIFTSEASYVKSLQQLSDMWMPALKKLLADAEFNSIFSNIEFIRGFSTFLCADIEKRINAWSDTQKIGDVFVKHAQQMTQLYKLYCQNYEPALAIVQQLSSKKKDVSKFLKQAEKDCGGFSLPYYLIMPVQRIPRYSLLLRELLNKTPDSHPDHADISAAFEAVQHVAVEINKGVGDAEKQKKLQDVAKKNIAGMDIILTQPGRFINWDGDLDISTNDGKSNYAFIFTDLFVLATEGKNRTVDRQIPLEHCWLNDLTAAGSTNCFEVITPEFTVFCTCKDKVSKDRWFENFDKTLHTCLQQKQMTKEGDATVRTFSYTFSDGGQYSGEWGAGKMQGVGKYTSCNGSTFSGTFVKGAFHGTGHGAYKHGETIEGEWARDMPHGKIKIVTQGFKNGKNFDGEYEAGKKKGKGILKWENGDVYDGEFDGDRFGGKGCLTKADGTKYDGDWKDGKRHGKGTYSVPNGETYEGDWVDGAKHGQGKQTEPNRSVYDGQWAEGKKHGQGTYECSSWKYEGQWLNDKRHGKGAISFSTGETYYGDWQYDKRSGSGRATWPDQSSYEGAWQDNKRSGKGVWTHPSGAKFDGMWKDDLKHGSGVFTDVDATTYEGEWLADRREGRGKQIYKSGATYDGQWKSNSRQGEGTYTWPDGAKYVGGWMSDRRNGVGKLESLGGIYEGEWKNDARDGKGTVKNKDGTTFVGEFSGDRKHGKGTFIALGNVEHEQIWREGILVKPGVKYFVPDLPDPVYF